MNLGRVDLNLLRVFDAIFEDRNRPAAVAPSSRVTERCAVVERHHHVAVNEFASFEGFDPEPVQVPARRRSGVPCVTPARVAEVGEQRPG